MEILNFQLFSGSCFPLHRRKHEKCMEIYAFSMILGSPRFPFNRNHEKKMEINTFSMILGFPRFPLHQKNKNERWKSLHFQWFWASHASHSTEEIMKNVGKSMHSQWFWVSHASHSTQEFVEFVSSISVVFFLGRLSRWLTRANVAIPSRDSAKKFAKKLRNDPLRESHFLNAYFLNSWGGCMEFWGF